MNTTWTKQGLLVRFGKVATILHRGLALIGLAAVVLVLVRGKTLFFDESAAHSAAVGSIRYDGAVSLLDGADDADTQKYRALANYVSHKLLGDIRRDPVFTGYVIGGRCGHPEIPGARQLRIP